MKGNVTTNKSYVQDKPMRVWVKGDKARKKCNQYIKNVRDAVCKSQIGLANTNMSIYITVHDSPQQKKVKIKHDRD